MSTTNPPPGGGSPAPGPTPGQWPSDARDLDAPDLPATGGGVNPAAIRAGHEPDVFAVKPIMAIPLAVLITFVIALVVTTVLFFGFFIRGPEDPLAHPGAVAANQEPMNKRLERVDREGRDRAKTEVDQPRLEPLRRLEGDGQSITRVELPGGNPPLIHPEDIRPDTYPGLQKGGEVKDAAGKPTGQVRVPIAEAMRDAAEKKELREKLFPVRKEDGKDKDAAKAGGAVRPSAGSAGRGVMPPPPKVEAKADAADKKDEKKEPEKKDPGAKEPEKKEAAPKEPGKKDEKKEPEKKSPGS